MKSSTFQGEHIWGSYPESFPVYTETSHTTLPVKMSDSVALDLESILLVKPPMMTIYSGF